MGKILLMVVLATALSGSLYSAQLHVGASEQGRRATDRAVDLLAEDVAQSGYAVGVQRLNERFEPFEDAGLSLGSGSADLRATPTASGGLLLRAEGQLGAARYPIEGEYVRLGSTCDLLGALFLHTQAAPALSLVGTGFQVRGEDTQPASRVGGRAILDGPGYTVAGVLADTLVHGAWTVPLGSMGELDLGLTLGGISDEGYLRELVGCTLEVAATAVDAVGTVAAGHRSYLNRTVGSPLAPEVMVVEGNARFSGQTRGYGVLVVGGDLVAEDDFIWEGLVISVGSGPASIRLSDGARVYGAVLGAGLPPLSAFGLFRSFSATAVISSLLSTVGGVAGSLGIYRRPMGLSLSDEAGVFFSEEALGRLADLFPEKTETRVVVIDERFGLAAGA